MSGSAHTTSGDGTTEMVTSGVKVLHFGGAGQSSSAGESSYREMSGMNANYEEAVRHGTQILSAKHASTVASQEKQLAQEASALHSIMQHTKTDKGYNIDTSTDEGREFMKTINEIDAKNKTNDYGWKQNAEAHAKADYSAVGVLSKLLLGLDAGVGGSVSAINDSAQTDSDSSSIMSENNVHAKQGNSERINKTDSFLESHGVDKNT